MVRGRTLLGRQIRLDMALESSETRSPFICLVYQNDYLFFVSLIRCCKFVFIFLHLISHPILRLQQSDPCVFRFFINECHKIFMLFSRYTWSSPHIRVNQIKAGIQKQNETHDNSDAGLVSSSKYKWTKFGSPEMNRIQKVAFQTPQQDFMSIPSYLNPQAIVQNLRICIRRLEEEDGEEEEEETVDDLLIRIRRLEEEEEAVEADDVNNVRRSTREKKANSKYQNKVK
uniref:Uncharacterized protein n=1 Tax=Brassica oleracea TaxID=3712 RepID=A0A3P6H690_BRAOL|nr:unnamed protein product [Brassica oleracea]